MTILDPVAVANLAVFLVQLPRGRTKARGQPAAPIPVEFVCLEQARAAGEVVISETGMTERVRLENHSSRDLFLQAGEVLRGGNQDRAVAADLIVPAPRHEPESHMVPVFCAEPERSTPMRGWTPDLFTLFDQTYPGRRLKWELRLGTQESVWTEISALRDVVFDLVSHGGKRSTPRYSVWELIETLEAMGWLQPYLYPLLPLAETYQKATGVLFVLGGKFNSAELYATPVLFRQLWPKLLYAMVVEALVEEKISGAAWQGTLPTKGGVTAWLLKDELPERLADMETMAQAFAALRAYPTIGDFPAYQYVADLNYSTLTSFSETEFVVTGPGALSGLRKCFADTGRLTDAEVIRLVQERQVKCFAAAEITFPTLPGRPLQLIDVQNLFCEVDKYARVAYPQCAGADGRCRIKQRFQPSATMLPLWYPTKWGINDKLNPLPG